MHYTLTKMSFHRTLRIVRKASAMVLSLSSLSASSIPITGVSVSDSEHHFITYLPILLISSSEHSATDSAGICDGSILHQGEMTD